MLQFDLGAEGAQAGEVLIDGPHADGAAAGQGHPSVAAAGQQRAEDEGAGAHRLDQLIRCFVVDGGRIENRPVNAQTLFDGRVGEPEMGEQPDHGADVLNRRQTA